MVTFTKQKSQSMELNNNKITKAISELLPNLGAVGVEDLLSVSHYSKKLNKEIILKSGGTDRKAFMILKGTVRGYIMNDDGVEKNVLLRSEGIFVGDVWLLFKNELQRQTYEAIGETHLLIINFEEFEELAFRNQKIMALYLNILKEAVLNLSYRVESLITMTNEERYIDLLKKNPQFLKSAYSKHVANYLGITPVSLSRIISRVKKHKD